MKFELDEIKELEKLLPSINWNDRIDFCEVNISHNEICDAYTAGSDEDVLLCAIDDDFFDDNFDCELSDSFANLAKNSLMVKLQSRL